MEITREKIIGSGSQSSMVQLAEIEDKNYFKDLIDIVEFEIDIKGISKLERHVKHEDYIMCYVHFHAGTEKLKGIHFVIWGESAENQIEAEEILTEEEKKVISEYALKELRKQRLIPRTCIRFDSDERKILREHIVGVGAGTSLINIGWERPNTPNTKDGVKKSIDSVEFEIAHKGIEKLERNIKADNEYIMCFVHFDAGTETLDGIYLSVWDEDSTTDEPIDANIFSKVEKEAIVEYALKELREQRLSMIETTEGLVALYDMMYPTFSPEEKMCQIIRELYDKEKPFLYKLAQDTVSQFLVSRLSVGCRVTVVVKALYVDNITPEYVTLETEEDENGKIGYYDLRDCTGVVCMDGETCIVQEIGNNKVKLLNEDGEQPKEFYLNFIEAGCCLYPCPRIVDSSKQCYGSFSGDEACVKCDCREECLKKMAERIQNIFDYAEGNEKTTRDAISEEMLNTDIEYVEVVTYYLKELLAERYLGAYEKEAWDLCEELERLRLKLNK